MRYALAVALAAVSVWGCAKAHGDAQVPDSRSCRQRYLPLSGRVVDQADLLVAAQEAALTQKLAKLEAETGHQLVVATVMTLQNRRIENYSLCLANHWGIGRKNINDGVVLLVAPNERRVRIEVGFGLQKALSNRGAERIIDDKIVPALRHGDYRSGIFAGVDGIIAQIDGPAS